MLMYVYTMHTVSNRSPSLETNTCRLATLHNIVSSFPSIYFYPWCSSWRVFTDLGTTDDIKFALPTSVGTSAIDDVVFPFILIDYVPRFLYNMRILFSTWDVACQFIYQQYHMKIKISWTGVNRREIIPWGWKLFWNSACKIWPSVLQGTEKYLRRIREMW